MFTSTKKICLYLIGFCLFNWISESQTLRIGSKSSGRTERYLELLQKYFAQPRHPFTAEENWLLARTGVIEQFEDIISNYPDIKLENQAFSSEVFVDRFLKVPVAGENIIATFEGTAWGTHEDEILVIGAHYDSDAETLGIDDNGSGVVAMLEVARMLAEALATHKYNLKYTVMFVAFDIQRHEHALTWYEEEGTGSHFFVREKLQTLLYQGFFPKFKGAILLDAILNYAAAPASQVLPEAFDETFPVANQHIQENGFKGDFIGLVNQDERYNSTHLTNTIVASWNSVANSQHFPLLDMEVKADKLTTALYEFLRQDHLAFWNNVVRNTPQPLPAVLLTDTGKWRNMPGECPHPCQVATILNENHLGLLDQTVETLFRTVISLQAEEALQTNGSNQKLATTISVVLSIILAVLFSRN